MHAHAHTHIHIYIYAYDTVYVCMCMYIYIYTYTYCPRIIALPLSSVRESLRTSGSLKVAAPAPDFLGVDDIDGYPLVN